MYIYIYTNHFSLRIFSLAVFDCQKVNGFSRQRPALKRESQFSSRDQLYLDAHRLQLVALNGSPNRDIAVGQMACNSF